jgi:hypothetical protein
MPPPDEKRAPLLRALKAVRETQAEMVATGRIYGRTPMADMLAPYPQTFAATMRETVGLGADALMHLARGGDNAAEDALDTAKRHGALIMACTKFVDQDATNNGPQRAAVHDAAALPLLQQAVDAAANSEMASATALAASVRDVGAALASRCAPGPSAATEFELLVYSAFGHALFAVCQMADATTETLDAATPEADGI